MELEKRAIFASNLLIRYFKQRYDYKLPYHLNQQIMK